MDPRHYLFPVISAVLLSTLGMPWLALVRHGRSSPKGTLHSRWVIFAWSHPIWAGLLRWSAIALAAAGFASTLWYRRVCT